MLQVIDSGTVEIILCGRKFMMDNTSGYLMENYAYVCYSMLKNCQDHDYCINDTFFFFNEHLFMRLYYPRDINTAKNNQLNAQIVNPPPSFISFIIFLFAPFYVFPSFSFHFQTAKQTTIAEREKRQNKHYNISLL